MEEAACLGLASGPNWGDSSVMSASSIVVLVTGDPVPETRTRYGGFADLIRRAAPAFGTSPWLVYDVRELDVLPDLTAAMAVIVTGSPFSVTEALPWMDRTAVWLRQLVTANVPLLGICFGHQLLGQALGGQVRLNPSGREMGTVPYTTSQDDPVFGRRGTTVVNSTHVDSLVQLPVGARAVGSTERDPHAAVRFGASAWGVQFHPEIDAGVMRQYLEARRALLLAEGFDVDAAERELRDAPDGAAVIERFLRLARAQRGLAA